MRIRSDGLVCFAIGLIRLAEPAKREGILGILFGGLLEIQYRRVGAMCSGAWLQNGWDVNQVQAAAILLRLRRVEVTLCVVWIERDSLVMIFHGDVKHTIVFIVGDHLKDCCTGPFPNTRRPAMNTPSRTVRRLARSR